MAAAGQATVTLTRRLARRLKLYCDRTGEQPGDVAHDLIDLGLDELERFSVSLATCPPDAETLPVVPSGQRVELSASEPPRRPVRSLPGGADQSNRTVAGRDGAQGLAPTPGRSPPPSDLSAEARSAKAEPEELPAFLPRRAERAP